MNLHAASARTYILIGIALLGLLALTIVASYLNLGVLNLIVTASISVASTVLIIFFYMHVRRSKPLLWIFVGAGFFCCAPALRVKERTSAIVMRMLNFMRYLR